VRRTLRRSAAETEIIRSYVADAFVDGSPLQRRKVSGDPVKPANQSSLTVEP